MCLLDHEKGQSEGVDSDGEATSQGHDAGCLEEDCLVARFAGQDTGARKFEKFEDKAKKVC